MSSGGTPMMTQEAEEKKSRKRASGGDNPEIPSGKVRCYISKQIYDEQETVELDYNGIRVRVHRRYSRA
jgi:hypothetical protein